MFENQQINTKVGISQKNEAKNTGQSSRNLEYSQNALIQFVLNPSMLGQDDILALQSSMGNRKVAQLLQEYENSFGMLNAGTNNGVIQGAWAKKANVAINPEADIVLYNKLVDEENIYPPDSFEYYIDKPKKKICAIAVDDENKTDFAMKWEWVPEGEDGEGEWNEVQYDNDDATDLYEDAQGKFAAEPENTRLGKAFNTLNIEEELVKDLLKSDQKQEEFRWLLSLNNKAVITELATYLTIQNKKLEDIHALYSQVAGDYAADVLAHWIATKGVEPTRIAFEKTVEERRIRFMDLYLTYALGQNANAGIIKLCRIQANYRDGVNGFAVLQADTNYAGAIGVAQRTGFIQFTCANGDQVDIHSHWETLTGKITSMHVQINGVNGLEINQWAMFFGDVRDAIITTHNNAGGVLAPTGGPLHM